MEKFLLAALCLAMNLPMSMMDLATEVSADLSAIASSVIHVEKRTDDTGNTITTFSKLDDFADAVRLAKPEISDYDLAVYILQYTDQEITGLSEEEVLSFLAYDNITTSSCYVGIDGMGNTYVSHDAAMPAKDRSPSDSDIKISTSYSHLKTDRAEKYYSVWATASWLQYPAVCVQDVFTLGTTGVFDDSYHETGSVTQHFYCRSCRNTTVRKRSVSAAAPVDNDLTLGYARFVPVLYFEPIAPRCDYCGGGGAKDAVLSTCIRYGIIADDNVNIRAGYAHKTFAQLSEYIAAPVAVLY